MHRFAICTVHKRGLDIFVQCGLDDSEKLIYSVCDILTAKQEKDLKIVFVDMPRAMDKRQLGGVYYSN